MTDIGGQILLMVVVIFADLQLSLIETSMGHLDLYISLSLLTTSTLIIAEKFTLLLFQQH